MSGWFKFGKTVSDRLGLLVSNVSTYGAPSRVVEKVQVPYRNGDLLIDTGTYNNYIVTYRVALINDVVADARALAEGLSYSVGYAKLTDSYNTGEFRYAAYYNQLDITMAHLNRYGQANISFDCKPQRYLDSGTTKVTFTSNGYLSNPTSFPAKPLIEITGNGTVEFGQLGTTDYAITVSNNASDTITIDCESMQCYRGNVNMNGSVELPDGFPTLAQLTTIIRLSGVTKVDITPRWWRL